MAGDWIPMRMNLADDEAVGFVSGALGMDPDMVVGKLHRLWSWANANTVNGHSKLITVAWLEDTLLRAPGFITALQSAKWVTVDVTGIRFSKFGRWNGESSKKRLNNAKRQSRFRLRKRNARSVTKALPEKRREEKSTEEEEIYIREREKSAPENAAESPAVRSAAQAGFELWSQTVRGHGLKSHENEDRPIFQLLDVLAQEPPIIHGGVPVGQHLLVPRACESLRLREAPAQMKSMAYACMAVRNLLSEWSRNGMPGANSVNGQSAGYDQAAEIADTKRRANAAIERTKPR